MKLEPTSDVLEEYLVFYKEEVFTTLDGPTFSSRHQDREEAERWMSNPEEMFIIKRVITTSTEWIPLDE